jgi:hypothetical protein
MSILYVTQNLLAGNDVAITASSEDVLYVIENLYNKRPSKPFRFTGKGAAGAPEWVACEFTAAKVVNFFGLFNHNLTALVGANDALILKGSATTAALQDWANPPWSLDLKSRLITGWNDLYQAINQNYRTYRLEAIDTAQPLAFVEIGELVLAQSVELPDAHITPNRRESPELTRIMNITPYGQHWLESLSHSVSLNLEIVNMSDPRQIDAVRTMILAIHAAGGQFILVPNSNAKFAYYAVLKNDGGFMTSIARGDIAEVTAWTLELETLVKGILLPS